ncbi:alpha/beta-hydrolase [Xylariaceae sp. FL0594]|nr:alpha/beta-hydrolase [Xylariaceae sp. FL0594]
MMSNHDEDSAGLAASPASIEEVTAYRVHISSQYLDLTKRKLETVRTPREFSEPELNDWWPSTGEVDPLIDFWVEQYRWREQEAVMNDLPQFRTGFIMPQITPAIRIQFLHARSPHPDAVPLLLIPPFPFPSLLMGHLIQLFTEPEDPANDQPFHLVIPSLPGSGFSDPLPTDTAVISSTAFLLDALMQRLNYPFYLASNAGCGASSPAQIDFKIAEWLSTQYPHSCLGTHFISPIFPRPQLKKSPLGWAKWTLAKSFRVPISGYCAEDFEAYERHSQATTPQILSSTPHVGVDELALAPNTLAHALCDSPLALLVFVLRLLRLMAPDREFTPMEIIHFTQVGWFKGPEFAVRFWGYCLQFREKVPKKANSRPRVGMTVFLGEDEDRSQVKSRGGSSGTRDRPASRGQVPYTCPSWARAEYDVLYTQRLSGKPGFLAWDRPEIIAAGARGVAAVVLKADIRLRPSPAPTPSPTAVTGGGASPPSRAGGQND